jgi:hypothetical protein
MLLPSSDLADHAGAVGTAAPQEGRSASGGTGARPFFAILPSESPFTVHRTRALRPRDRRAPAFPSWISGMVHRLGTEVLLQIRKF